MSYHVSATWTGVRRAFAFNWSDEDVRTRLVAPYEAGSPVVLQGQQFEPSQTRFQVIEAEEQLTSATRDAWTRVAETAKDVTEEFLTRAPGLEVHERLTAGAVDPRTVMVVYGRDSDRTSHLFAFLRALDLKPLEWGQLVGATGESSPYIGDVLARAFEVAQAAVVLLTPDDEARLAERLWTEATPDAEKALIGQARPNVYFEAGMAFGSFPERTVLVELGEQHAASDMAGRHSVRLDNTPERRNALAERLATAGCPIDRQGDMWLSAGDFE